MFASAFAKIHTYRIHIALVYIFLVTLQTLVFSTPSINTVYAIAAFTFVLLAAYITNKYFDYEEDLISQPHEANQHPTLLLISGLCFLVGFLILYLTHQTTLPYLLFIPISIAYSMPLPLLKWRVKETIFKNVYAAGVGWYLSCVFVINYYSFTHYTFTELLLLNLNVFLLVWLYQILWDVRDIKGDALIGAHTIPVVYGLATTKVLGFGIIMFTWQLNGFVTSGLFFYNLVFLGLMFYLVQKDFPAYFFHTIIYVQIIVLLSMICVIRL